MTWTSELDPVAVGGMTVPALVRAVAVEHGERTALVDGSNGASVTYRELWWRVERIAAWLAADGLVPGDCVALWAPNVPPWAGIALGALHAGATVTTINPAAVHREVRGQVVDAGASVVVTTASLAAAALDLSVRRVIVLGNADVAVPLSAVLAAGGPGVDVDVSSDAAAAVPYSSGTTGLPKGVVLTHANLVTQARQIARSIGATPDDVTLAVAPFFHILGLTAALLVPLSVGATVVTMSRFDPPTFLELLERYRVTYIAVPPPVAAFLARSPDIDRHELGHLRLIAVGGAPLPAAVERELAARFPECAIGQGWGLTETSGAVSVPRAGEGSAPGSVGRLLANTELRVVDPTTGSDVGPDRDGELWVRGPQIMAGYLGRPEATADIVDAEGWLHTGDLGRVDRAGNIFIVDRLKELIKVNAFQVAPAELEGLLLTHPAVADVAVVPEPNDRTGEAPVAVVVPREGSAVDGDALMAWLAERVAPYKRLAGVRIADSLPRTPSGKLLRRDLIAART